MQLDFDKKKKCWCIYRSLELENIYSQISTNSPPHVVHSQCLCILRGTCVCARTDATNWVPGSEKWLRPKSGPCQPAQWSCFFLQKFCLCLPSFCQKHHYHHLVFGCKSICLVERDAVLLTQCCVSTRPTDPKRVKKGHSLLAFHRP